MNLTKRPRRLRNGEVLRKMVRETRMDVSALIYPAFVAEGLREPEEISAMPGQYRHSTESLLRLAEDLLKSGVDKMMLFGIPQVLNYVCQGVILVTTVYSGVEYFAKNWDVFKEN